MTESEKNPLNRKTSGNNTRNRLIKVLLVAVLFGLSGGYDFYRGYHEVRSITGGVVYVFFGLTLLAVLFALWLGSSKKNLP